MLKKFKFKITSHKNVKTLRSVKLSNSALLKIHLKKLKQKAGRNNSGKITIYHRGGGVKRIYRKIDFIRTHESTGIVLTLEYDPYRKAHIAAVFDNTNNRFYYMIQPQYLKVGDIVQSGWNASVGIGNSLPIFRVPISCLIHNVSTRYNFRATLSRSAGNFCQLLKTTFKYAHIKLPSKAQRHVPADSFATIGAVSNEMHMLMIVGKAGRNRWLHKRPTVRGVAMNPVDHPHGGGEGKKSKNRTAVTPWGKPTTNKKTSNSAKRYKFKINE
uniref:Ribosomal protein L2 n=1 Tax=Toxarium undulatum TaxID=210620 RepID=A0A2U9GJ27_9STRA|nr:ribosomal protein L2 [Toxarium undulatum]AWQ64141.1 ribosomal protein L2 [Toxarium undulatum]